MTELEAIYARHSVRQYLEKDVEPEKLELIQNFVTDCNFDGEVDIQLIKDEPKAFSSGFAKYGKFKNVRYYLAVVAPKGIQGDVAAGYYGEKVVVFIQTLGLNTCWAGVSYKKISQYYWIRSGYELKLLIAFGYGANQGTAHPQKKSWESFAINESGNNYPEWFVNGIKIAMLAPSAINQQKFEFVLLKDGKVEARRKFSLFGFTNIDLGIAKYHFEIGAGIDNFEWQDNDSHIIEMIGEKRTDLPNNFELFAHNMLQLVANQKENTVISPFRLMAVLYVLSEFVENKEDKTKLIDLLSSDNTTIDYLKQFSNEDFIETQIATSLWLDRNVTTSALFRTIANDWKIEPKLFSETAEQTQKLMVSYVSEKTGGLVNSIPFKLSNDVKPILIDSLYFKAKWMNPFDSQHTRKGTFYSVDGRQQVDFMNVGLHTNYYSDNNFESIEIPYEPSPKNRLFSMRIYMPHKGNDLDSIIDKIKSIEHCANCSIILCLPKFTICGSTNISDLLNIKDIDLNLLSTSVPLAIEQIIQQGTVSVSEKGTDAGMATYCKMMNGSAPRKIIKVKINRPFIFEIVEAKSRIRLFSGIVNKIYNS